MRTCTWILCKGFLLASVAVGFASGADDGQGTTTQQSAEMAFEPGTEHTTLYELTAYESEIGRKLTFSESPVLAARVANGELPPLDQRLPQDPLVIQPSESIGKYGGIWRRANLGILPITAYSEGDEDLFTRDYYTTQRWNNIVRDAQMSADATTFTFLLRRGMKWSDGAPFTADDFLFWYDDLMLNEELSPVPPRQFLREGQPAVMDKVDDVTVRVTFAAPYGYFLDMLANAYPPQPFRPKHYLQQFHPKYAQQAELDSRIKESGFKIWTELMNHHSHEWRFPAARPVIGAFDPIDEQGVPLRRFVRNPYYWKVDTAGNQLPYIDRVEEVLMSDGEAILLRGLAGEIDVQSIRIGGTANLPVLKENEAKGNYRIVHYPGHEGPQSGLFLNFFHEDEVLRELFLNKDFRIALSLGMDRQTMNDLNYKGQGEGRQMAPASTSPWYIEEYAKRYTEHDPERASQILDGLGLAWDRNNEWRLRPDGQRLRVEIKVFTPWPPENMANCELIKETWKELGIDVVLKPVERALWVTTVQASDFDIASYVVGSGSAAYPPLRSPYVFPSSAQSSYWGVQWAQWLTTDGAKGVEPPAEVKELFAMYERLSGIASQEERNEIYAEAYRIHADNLWMIGGVAEPNVGRYFLFKNNVGNTTEYGNANWRNADYKFPYSWSTYFFKN